MEKIQETGVGNFLRKFKITTEMSNQVPDRIYLSDEDYMWLISDLVWFGVDISKGYILYAGTEVMQRPSGLRIRGRKKEDEN